MTDEDIKEITRKEVALIHGDITPYLQDDKGARRTLQEAVRKITVDIVVIHDRAKIALAEYLTTIYDKEWYKTWGYPSWDDYVGKELDFQYRQSMYLIKIWKELVGKRGIPVEILRKKSWSKLKDIAALSEIEAVSTKEIKGLIEGSDKMTVEEVVFKAKEIAHAAGGKAAKEKTHRLTFTLFEEQYENVKKALEAASEVSTSEKPGANLDLMCTSFLASHIHGDKAEELKRLMKEIEDSTGAHILVTLDGEIVHSNKEFDK